MVGVETWCRYFLTKLHYSVTLTRKHYLLGEIPPNRVFYNVWKTLIKGRMTYLRWTEGEQMAPMIGPRGGTLLVRKIPVADARKVFVGDVVVILDPKDFRNYIVRRLAAVEGDEMVSDVLYEEPFTIGEDWCWILADNKKLTPKEAYDSRYLGQVYIKNIIGRVIYSFRDAADHGPVKNSEISMEEDSAVLEVELDVDELTRNHKAAK
ncbi:hypothetical protein Sango_0304300 [Sesamum angolense]|uniref:Mitochondrial inner membrane protease subunit 2 n=1 Tax=Sesamum angolense TaxID=2727404 RepID=A0AAE1X9B1_9LAMI|nr:hypothetical protein Sango_0304300 [Sesamum angolense]